MGDIRLNRGGYRAAIVGIALAAIYASPIERASAQQKPQTSAEKIDRMIEQLGDEDYLVRQRAQDKLAKLGFEACDVLAVASSHEDLEIASRAKYLLRLMEVEWTVESDPTEVKKILDDFHRLSMQERRVRIAGLAALPDGMGVVALCRLARFEKSGILSRQAALEILKLEPFDEELRRLRGSLLRERLTPSRRTAVNWILTHVELREDPKAPMSKWAKLAEAERSGSGGVAPRLNARTVMWLLYHQAMLEGDREDLAAAEKSVAAARNVDKTAHPDLLGVHLDIGNTLQRRGFFDWAEAEYARVIGTGVWEPGYVAYDYLAQMKHDGGEHAMAADVMREAIEFTEKRAKSRSLGDVSYTHAHLRARMNYFLSCDAAQKGDTPKQREYVDLSLKADPTDIDALISRHGLPDTDEIYRRKTKEMVAVAAAALRNEISRDPDVASNYNQWAWLVGNTSGDLGEALSCSQTALKLSPNNGAYLDTLAHVFFARGEYDKAVKTQEEAVRFEPHSGLIAEKLKLFRGKLAEERPGGEADAEGPEEKK